MDRKKIKKQAKEILKTNLWKIFIPYLIIELTAASLFFIIDENIINEGYRSLIKSFIQITMYPLTIGILAYIIKIVKNKKYKINDIFKPYNIFFFTFGLYFITGLFITLGMFCLIIPGVILAIIFHFAPFIMADGEKDPINCIKESNNLINGYKWDYFKFALSFIGWYLIIIVAFWFVIPYVMVCEVLYYEELKKLNKSN
ncbi:MAG: YciC family protein [Bacilli bacterium]|nr:YciC family protein [Bacilli bacterium]MDD3895989.1 YciC family protein [Bacilli bacterium]MDD4408115.1 YciC family protein [Bacilli bacterium]